MGGLDYATLREVQRQELSSPRLTQLGEDFYTQVISFLSEKKSEAFSSNSMLKVREYENLQRIVISIKEKREEKILLMALRGDKINGGATPEELGLFGELVGVLRSFRKRVDDSIQTPSAGKDAFRIRIIKDIEAYKGLDGNVYGPFGKESVVSLPKSEVDWLIKAKIAEISR